MARRQFGRQAMRAPRRATDWHFAAAVPASPTSCPNGANTPVGIVTLTEGSPAIGTIVRIRGCVHLEIAPATAARVLQGYAIGIGLFDDRAVAVAAGAGLPRPANDADDEAWMWWHCGFIGDGPDQANPPSPESEGTGRKIGVDITVDSKAMRKWDENQQLVWLVENFNVSGTLTEIDAFVFGRMLIKLN